MKYLKYAAVFFTVVLSSCTQWLAIEPESEVTDRELYKNPEGYHKILNGIYLNISEPGLYGKELSWGAVEAWAWIYKLSGTQTSYSSLRDLKYEDSGPIDLAKTFWTAGYKMIAQANDLIAHTEDQSDGFFDKDVREKNLILGEAYALRAMLHFDLLRIFADAPALGKTNLSIPYVEVYPSIVNPKLPTGEVLARVIRDLEKARGLLASYDLVGADSTNLFKSTSRFAFSSTDFFANRGVRLNYLAVTGLLARVCLYAGETDKALANARKIIGYVDEDALALTKTTEISKDTRMTTDVLFGFYYNELAKTYDNYTGDKVTPTSLLVLENPVLWTGVTADYRKAFVSTVQTSYKVMNKYVGASDGKGKECLIPNVRISEMYYIAAECLAVTDMAQATDYLKTAMKARYTAAGVPKIDGNTPLATFYDYLTDEYRKELVGEGQQLFYYKRRNIPIKYSIGAFQHKGKLTLPIPESESAAGN